MHEHCEWMLGVAVITVIRDRPNGISCADLHDTVLGGRSNWTVGTAFTIYASAQRLQSRHLLRIYSVKYNSYLLPIYTAGEWPTLEYWPPGRIGSECPVPKIRRHKLKPIPYGRPFY